jgi:hypothetical protein
MADIALSPQFALQRSYWKGIGFYAPAGSVKDFAANVYTILWPPLGTGVAVRAVMKPEWWNWSSNKYTPDWIFAEYYAFFQSAPSTHYTYLPFTVYQHQGVVPREFFLTNRLDVFTDFYEFPLPAAPPTYWLPPL